MIDPGLLALLLPAVIGAVQFARDCGLTGNALRAASLVIGSGLAMSAILLDVGAARAVLTCILVGLGACGLWDFGKLIGVGAGRQVVSTPLSQATPLEFTASSTGGLRYMDDGNRVYTGEA